MENSSVNFYRMDSQHMNDAIDRIVVEVHAKKSVHNKNVILLTGCGSATGVTTLSINLAIALSLTGWKTLLIDCDLRKGNKYKRLGKDVPIGLSEYLSHKEVREEVINQTNYPLLDYVSCGSSETSAVRLLCSAEMEDFMSWAQLEYDYVIVDSPSLNIVSDSNILFPLVDGIILVAALNHTTKRQLSDGKRSMERYLDKYYGLIINQVEISEYSQYIKDYDYFKKKNMDKNYIKNLKKLKRNRKIAVMDDREEDHE